MYRKKTIGLFILFACLFATHAQTIVIMQNARVRLCKGKLTDSDKGKKVVGDYDHNENYTLTLSVPGAKNITLKFKTFCTEKDNDILRIFDGKDTSASLLGTYSGTKSAFTVVSSDSFITLHFKSDKSVACSGWEVDFSTTIIPPKAPTLAVAQAPKCKDNFILFNSNIGILCDSVLPANCAFTGPIAIAATSVTAQNCSGGKATQFKVNLNNALILNGNYTLTLITYYKDYCDSVYKLTSKLNFSVADCPLKVVLTADNDTICKNSCTWLRAAVSGGNVAKYQYTWTPASLSGAGPIKVCPTVNTRYILKVTDGSSIPSADTVDIVVLSPPLAQKDTDVCYYSSNFFLNATPPGGKWFGTGIVNSSKGEFKPLGNYGTFKVWYQIGTCADTVLVTSTVPWNLENQFCPGTAPAALWWYAPAGGIWSGPNVTPTGIFDPKTSGTFKDTYTWKGCISVKTVIVQTIKVKKFDTACESTTLDTLQFSPYGIYPNWFPGLINSYYQTVNPSQMGGPGTKTIIWNGGGCKDTTKYTILEAKAGPTDTFCPSNGVQILKNFRPLTGYTWKGHGITNPLLPNYDPAFFFGLGKTTFRDTLTIQSGICKDKKYVYLIPTKITKPDTQFFCFESAPKAINNALVGLTPNGGTWSGKGIAANGLFTALVAGYGGHKLTYLKNGCFDTLIAFVRSKPIVQNDTTICIASLPFNCYRKATGGFFTGNGITNATIGTFNPSVAGRGIKTITYTSKEGCIATFKVTVDTMPVLYYTNIQTTFCFKDSPFALLTNITGGTFSGKGVVGKAFYPARAGTGNHKLTYILKTGTCTGSANLDVVVGDTLIVKVTPPRDTICPGETVWLRSKGYGGDNTNYSYGWSHGQNGSGTFVTPSTSQSYTVTLTDGCSNPATALVQIFKHPKPWFNVATSAPRCFGQNGYAKVKMKDNDPYKYFWDMAPPFGGDSLVAPVGNMYRLTATNTKTGCQSDTQILIPGFKAIQAAYLLNIQNGEKCITNIWPTLQVFNGSTGGETGNWYWGDGSSEAYDPNGNPSHTYAGDLNSYKMKLVIFNSGGCKDSAESILCFRDTIVVFIPNTFTPDGDGINEVFLPVVSGSKRYEMIIYNRWGQILFETKTPGQGWDGTSNGKPAPEGVYAYKVVFKGKKTFSQTQNGSITLLRRKL